MPVLFHRHVSRQLAAQADAVGAKRVATGSLCVEYADGGISVTLDLRMVALTGAVNLPVADDTGTQVRARIASDVTAVLVRKRVLTDVLCTSLNTLLMDRFRDYVPVITTLRDQWESFAKAYSWDSLKVPDVLIPWEICEVVGDAVPTPPDNTREIDLKDQSAVSSKNKKGK